MKMASIGCLETSAVNQPTLRNNPEDGRIQVNSSGSLRYRTVSVTVHSSLPVSYLARIFFSIHFLLIFLALSVVFPFLALVVKWQYNKSVCGYVGFRFMAVDLQGNGFTFWRWRSPRT